MPLYAGVGGGMREIGDMYAGVGGASVRIDKLYGGVNGAAVEIMSSGYKWKRYALAYSLIPTGNTVNVTYTLYNYQQTIVNVAEDLSQISFTENGEALFAVGASKATHITNVYNSATAYSGRYITLNDDGATIKTYAYATGMQREDQTAKKVLCISGKHPDTDTLGFTGEIWEPYAERGEYVGTITAKELIYPLDGILDGYYYVFDGEVTWKKYRHCEVYEPSKTGSESSFSASALSYPILMASQAKRDGDGVGDWGKTVSASSASNIRSYFSSYPYTSFAATLSADTLYEITAASILSYKRRLVTEWSKTDEYAGEYVETVSGHVGDYPKNGAVGGYWYIMDETV